MGEILINSLLKVEVAVAQAKGTQLTGFGVGNVPGANLPTCDAYRKRLRRLNGTIKLFGSLVQKDMAELNTFISNIEASDNG